MTDIEEMRMALKTKRTVEWRGRMDYERMIGTVTGIIYRYANEQEQISLEVTGYGSSRSVTICRPCDVHFWNPVKTEGAVQV